MADNRVPPAENGAHGNDDTDGVAEVQARADGTNDTTKQIGLGAFGGLLMGAIFAAILTLPDHHGSKKLMLKFGDILDHNKWPSKLLLFILFTVVFSSSFLLAMIPLRKMVMRWPFYLRALIFVAAIGFYVTFCVILSKKLPNFTLGSIPGFCVILSKKLPNFTLGSIPGFWVVCLLCCSLFFLGGAAYAMISKAYSRIVSSYLQG